jgi:membrane-associated phospholipid phosphatase
VENHFYDWFGFNKNLFLLINKVHAPLLDQAALLITRLGHPALYPFYMAAALLLAWRHPSRLPQKNVVVFALSYAITSALIVPAIKAILDFPRPLAVLGEHAVIILGNPELLHSFPSGHAAFAVLMAASLAPGISRRGKIALVIFALLVCLSRILVGAHFPADILGGAAISLLVVPTVHYLIAAISKCRSPCDKDKP